MQAPSGILNRNPVTPIPAKNKKEMPTMKIRKSWLRALKSNWWNRKWWKPKQLFPVICQISIQGILTEYRRVNVMSFLRKIFTELNELESHCCTWKFYLEPVWISKNSVYSECKWRLLTRILFSLKFESQFI